MGRVITGSVDGLSVERRPWAYTSRVRDQSHLFAEAYYEGKVKAYCANRGAELQAGQGLSAGLGQAP